MEHLQEKAEDLKRVKQYIGADKMPRGKDRDGQPGEAGRREVFLHIGDIKVVNRCDSRKQLKIDAI